MGGRERLRQLRGSHLSRREREIAVLIAEGLSNRDIADRLFIAQRTAEGHVEQILGKLGFRSRAHVAAWVASGAAGLDARDEPSLTRQGLPPRLTTFIGRASEIAYLMEAIAHTPLVTLAGPGGIGKTRLAVEVASRATPRFEHGAAFVDFATLTDARLVAETAVTSLGLQVRANQPTIRALLSFLSKRDTLLVFDNCEHVIHGCAPLVHEILAMCPLVRVLATSRESLGVDREVVWRVQPMNAPSADAADLEQALNFDALVLFADRAQAALPSFALTEANLPTVAQLCGRLDGIPLAIELAASMVRTLTVDEMLNRMGSRLSLLTAGPRTAAERQQTMRGAIDWSYELLAEQERVMFCRLSVFVGSFNLDAVESVATASMTEARAMLETLTRLIDKSLVLGLPSRDGVSRYRLLETLREYASERLDTGNATDELRRRHAHHFAAIAQVAAPQLIGPDQRLWLEGIEADLDNYRAAIAWALEYNDPMALQLPAALFRFWNRARPKEGVGWLRAALAAITASEAVRAEALEACGELEWVIGEYAASARDLDESLTLWRRLGDQLHQGRVLDLLGLQAYAIGDVATGARFFEEALGLLSESGDSWRLASLLNNVGYLAHQRGGGKLPARESVDHALALARQSRDLWMTSLVLDSLATIEFDTRDYRGARRHWSECLTIARELGDLALAAYVIEGIARLLVVEKKLERASELFAAADSIREVTGAVRDPFWDSLIAGAVADARTALSVGTADGATRRGSKMSPADAIASALEGSSLAAASKSR